MKKICVGLMVGVFLFACSLKPYQLDKQKITDEEISVENKILDGVNIRSVEKSSFEKADIVYYAEDEIEMAQVIQYAYEKGIYKIAYQSNKTLDINLVANYLSYLNPFDLSLTQSTLDYKQGDEVLYRSYSLNLENLDKRYSEADEIAKDIVEKIITPRMHNDEKIKAIHDYIVKTTVYDAKNEGMNDKSASIFSGAGVLIDKRAVCTGYSRAFMMLAKKASIPALYVSSDIINHGWNLVYGSRGWRFIDVTWDDALPDVENRVSDKFLNMNVEDFAREGKHVFDEEKNVKFYLRLAENFYNKNGSK
ncbi:MAG: transglutaminase domain-containing protein [Longicatena sp.]